MSSWYENLVGTLTQFQLRMRPATWRWENEDWSWVYAVWAVAGLFLLYFVVSLGKKSVPPILLTAAVALSISGRILIRANWDLAMGSIVAGCCAGILAFWFGRKSSEGKPVAGTRVKGEWAFLLLIFMFFAFFRLFELHRAVDEWGPYEAPPMRRALEIWYGEKNLGDFLKMHYGTTAESEESYPFLGAILLIYKFYGFTPMASRMVAVAMDFLLFFLMYGLFKEVSNGVHALLALGFIATSRWDILLSRDGVYFTMSMALLTASLWLFVRGWNRNSWGSFALAGALGGFFGHMYLAARTVPFLFVAILAHPLLFQPRNLLRRSPKVLICFVLMWMTAFSWWHNPGWKHTFVGPDRDKGVFHIVETGQSPYLVELSEKYPWMKKVISSGFLIRDNGTKAYKMLFGLGAWEWDMGEIITPVLSGLLFLGVLMGMARIREFQSYVMLLWLMAGIAPGLMSYGIIPRRMVSLIPAIYFIMTWPLAWLITEYLQAWKRWPTRVLAGAGGLAGMAALSYFTFFHVFLLPNDRPPMYKLGDAFRNLEGTWRIRSNFLVAPRDALKVLLEQYFQEQGTKPKVTWDDCDNFAANLLEMGQGEENTIFLLTDTAQDRLNELLSKDLFPDLNWVTVPTDRGASYSRYLLVTTAQARKVRHWTFRRAQTGRIADSADGEVLAHWSDLCGQGSGKITFNAAVQVPSGGGWQFVFTGVSSVKWTIDAQTLRLDPSTNGGTEPILLGPGLHAVSVEVSCPIKEDSQVSMTNGKEQVVLGPRSLYAPHLAQLGYFKAECVAPIGPMEQVVVMGNKTFPLPADPVVMGQGYYDDQGNLYLFEGDRPVVVVYSPEKKLLRHFTYERQGVNVASIAFGNCLTPQGEIVVSTPQGLQNYKTDGTFLQTQENSNRLKLASSPAGEIYAADFEGIFVQKLGKDLQPMMRWGALGLKDGEFFSIQDLAVGPDGKVYVLDESGRLQIFTPDGKFVKKWVFPGKLGQKTLRGLHVGPGGMVQMADRRDGEIRFYDQNGCRLLSPDPDHPSRRRFPEPQGIDVGPGKFGITCVHAANFFLEFSTPPEWKGSK